MIHVPDTRPSRRTPAVVVVAEATLASVALAMTLSVVAGLSVVADGWSSVAAAAYLGAFYFVGPAAVLGVVVSSVLVALHRLVSRLAHRP
ncbi:hypothetical protein BH11ACT8_BH11ACT8_32350 [soil metagenome]